jgi:NAD(P)-dependent dehydrogenase (short-subunit alcohol dehydrogenase family)
MKNVLITGCSSGFGLEIALRLARDGWRVFATQRDPSRAETLLRARRDDPLALELLALDVLDDASVSAALARVAAAGPLDVLVNNAGIELRGPIEEVDDDEARRQFDTNVFGALRLMRAVLPGMRARGSGTIVNVSSIAGIVARPFGGLYAASKHALEAISEALHFEVSRFGVRVVLIEPGQFATRLLDNAFVARRFTPASPYFETSQRFDVAVRKLAPGGVAADASEVAALIAQVLREPAPRLRYLAGKDAELIASVYKRESFEGYEAAMRSALDWHE